MILSLTLSKPRLTFLWTTFVLFFRFAFAFSWNQTILGHTQISLKVTKVHPFLALTKPFPYWMVHWCFPLQIVWISLFLPLTLFISQKIPLLLHLTQIYGCFRSCLCTSSLWISILIAKCFYKWYRSDKIIPPYYSTKRSREFNSVRYILFTLSKIKT